MGVRLKAEFHSDQNNLYKIEIHDSTWVAAAYTFNVDGTGFQINYNGETDDIVSPIVGSNVTINAYNESTQFDSFISDLTEHQENRFRIVIYNGTDLYWAGWILQDLIRLEDSSKPYVYSITASDGFAKLSNTDYDTDNTVTQANGITVTRLNEIILNALVDTGLSDIWGTTDKFLEIAVDWWETTSHTYDTATDPMYLSGVDVSILQTKDDAGIITYMSGLDVLKQLATLFNARVYQANGRFIFEQYGVRSSTSRTIHTYTKLGQEASDETISDEVTLDQTIAGGARLAGNEFNYLPAMKRAEVTYAQKFLSPWFSGYTYNTTNTSISPGFMSSGDGISLLVYGRLSYDITDTNRDTANDTTAYSPVYKVQIKIEDGSNPGTYYYYNNTYLNGFPSQSPAWSTTAGYFYLTVQMVNIVEGRAIINTGVHVATTDIPVSGIVTVSIELHDRWDYISRATYSLVTGQTESWSLPVVFSRANHGVQAAQGVIYASTNSSSDIDSDTTLDLGSVIVSDGFYSTGGLAVYNGTTWVAASAWRKGSTGTGKGILNLLTTEALALHYRPIKQYEGAIVTDANFQPVIGFDSENYLRTGGSFNANEEQWDSQYFLISRDATTIGDVDPITGDLNRAPSGMGTTGSTNTPSGLAGGRVAGMDIDLANEKLGPFQQVTGGAAIVGGLKDGEGSFGTSGQVLSSTVTGLSWITSASSNDYVTGMTFNTSDGIVTLTRSGGLADITTDLDGRYLTTHPAIPNSGSIDNSNGVVVQDITIDAYGHSTAWGTVDLDDRFMQLGDPQVVTVKNMEATATLAKGTPVYAVDPSSSGNIVGVKAADASSSATMPAVVIMNESVTAGSEGEALIVGVITGVDTSSFTSGDVVYVASGGGFTNVKPTGTNLIQNLGVVMKVHATNGSGVIYGSGRANDVPNIPNSQAWVGNASGVATPTTLSITNWNTAYTYSTVGHLPLAGGTLTGGLTGTTATFSGQVTIPAVPVSNTDAASKQYIDNKVAGALIYLGTWNASTNTPTLVSGTGTVGTYYIVATDGTTTLDGISDWITGDWAVFSDLPTDAWQKIDNTSILGGAGTGGNIAAWSGSGTSVTLTDAPITYSGSNTTFAGTIAASNLSGTNTGDQDLSPYAPLASPTFTGSPRSVTPATASNDTSVATTAYVKAQGYSTTAGTVTSVAMTVPTGLTVSGTPITTSGTLAVVFASGYSIPTNTGQSNWNTAYAYSQVGHLPLAGGTLTAGATINMSGTLTIDGSSSVKMLVKGGARIALENANATDSFYIANTGGNLASILDLGSTLTIAENGGASTFAGNVEINGATGITGLNGITFQNGCILDDSIGAEYLKLKYNGAAAGGLQIFDNQNTIQGYLYADGGGTSNFGLLTGSGQWGVRTTENSATSLFYGGGDKLSTTSTGVTVTGVVTATGGTSTQWNTAYGWGDHAGLYLSLGGGTMSGDVDMGGNRITDGVFVTQSGTSDEFVKGDGTLDSTAYLALTGGTLSGDVTFTGATHHAMWDKSASALEFWDNAKLTFGDPGGTPDLSIYHDGSNSYIKDTGTGNLEILADSLSLLNAAGSEYYARFYTNGAAYLYHNGIAKLNTTSTGVTITGGWVTDGVSVATANVEHTDNTKSVFGTGNDLSIYHDGSNSYITNATGEIFIKGADDLSIQDTDGTNRAIFQANAQKLYYDGSLKFETTSTGVTIAGSIKMSDDTDTASASKVGTQRYRTSGSNSYVDMCMQTGATTYEWINILENNW